jgi:hypothetical protein
VQQTEKELADLLGVSSDKKSENRVEPLSKELHPKLNSQDWLNNNPFLLYERSSGSHTDIKS